MNDDFIAKLGIIANILQVANYNENIQQTSNDELMKKLEMQDSIYLQTIVLQNNEIIKLLKGVIKDESV